jgi:hypothetical protein
MKLFFIALSFWVMQTASASINLQMKPSADQTPSLFTQTLALAHQNHAKAQYHLGMLLNNGMGGAMRDPVQAFSWFKKAADSGDVLAQYKVGCYYAGQFAAEMNLSVDLEQALKFKLMAANGNYALAQHDVAMMYAKQKDWQQAVYWSKRAADQGALNAILYYATLVSHQDYGQFDPVMAWVYGKIASTLRDLDLQRGQAQTANDLQADKNLQAFLDKIDTQFTPEQKETAHAKAKAWQAQPSAITLEAKRGVEALKALLNAS